MARRRTTTSYNLHRQSEGQRRSRRHRMIKAAVNGAKEIKAAQDALSEAVEALINLQTILADSSFVKAHRRSIIIGKSLMEASSNLVILKSEVAKGASKT